MDQRGERKMYIAGIYKKDTEKLKRAERHNEAIKEREEKESKRREDEEKVQAQANLDFFVDEQESQSQTGQKRKELDDEWTLEEVVKVRQRNMHGLEKTALACDRIDISSRNAALLCNSYAMDMGWLTASNRLTETLDKRKLDRWRVNQ